MIDFAKLSAPFDPASVSWRIGNTTGDKKKAMALAYIDARDIYDRLDEVAGPANWQCRYPIADKKTVCEIGIKIGEEWVWKANGAGDSKIESEKGALSDSLKRAAVAWGMGRYLYDIDSPWVEIEPQGNSFRIKASERPKLLRALGGNAATSERSNGSTRPPARQQPAYGMDGEAMASAIIDRFNMATNMEALNATANHEPTKVDIDQLPDDLKTKVRKAYSAKKMELNNVLGAG